MVGCEALGRAGGEGRACRCSLQMATAGYALSLLELHSELASAGPRGPPRLARFAGCPRDVTPGPASREPVLCWPPWRLCSCVLPGAPLAFPLGAGPPGSPLSAPAPPSTGPPPLLSGPCTWFRPRLRGLSSSLDCLGRSLGFTAAGMVVAGPEPCISACELLPSPEPSSPCALLLGAHELFSDICSMCFKSRFIEFLKNIQVGFSL